VAIWEKDLKDVHGGKGVIPRAVRFLKRGEQIVVFALESGTM
jgi:hypothetical protein